jgi:hypothetical protein
MMAAIFMRTSCDLEAVGNADSEARALALRLLADCSTKIIYQEESSEAPHTADVLGLSATERGELRIFNARLRADHVVATEFLLSLRRSTYLPGSNPPRHQDRTRKAVSL